ncbi:MAG: AvaI/BsoBI family type II restriction endonuclease [Rhodocyclaceae bacterium]|nr:AvaI/BsoBI family type II restriction endonuclease [Rhodocyclaceae bacterium]
MVRRKLSLPHLKNAKDLLTPYENTRAGFVQMALEKSHRASPFVTQARDLAEQLKYAKTPRDLVGKENLRGALLTAAGISDKAAGHFDPASHDETIEKKWVFAEECG